MIKTKIKNKKVLLSVFFICLVVIAGIFYLKKSDNKYDKPSIDASNISYSPPTEEEKKSGNDAKQTILDNEQNRNSSTPPDGDLKAVKPVITYASQYGSSVELSAYIPNIFEEGGVCTADFVKGSEKLSKSINAIENVNSVDCPTIKANSSEFKSKGTWSVILTYKSASATGSSESKNIEVK